MTASPATPRPEPAPLTLEDFARAVGPRATPARLADLDRFRMMVTEKNEVMNLVGPATVAHFWSRHALDSAQLLALAPDARVWADLGAGAGFPGVVLAILLKGEPGARVHLVDSLAKRCRFLDEVVEALGLPATVHCARAEALNLKADVVTARAMAPMAKLLGFALPYFRNGAQGLFLKGENVAAELNEARKSWSFDDELLSSLSDPRGRVVRIRRLSRAK
ncbi:16S rRNA (guanine(527)-N(7))-methyltransferase RsmG [Caulobacter sp. 17J80-11]|uniref:16S rRNA (guanine(527)-N(7))-methyltransferase RsmG n=1 Tax=Caulobacter sp. 17J80-11 TaxID=2763502 RepID=UPI0016535F8B|nr:16S rRNA (guanine(527)-N(7))-methyltransferase RsmG [Caulobacter sp. 17J80-11]MBC6983347.1 16S rRNA (guanine(527)-N(7))-methyltransferase RsmG [Caulobacter sp. 17J80-11]